MEIPWSSERTASGRIYASYALTLSSTDTAGNVSSTLVRADRGGDRIRASPLSSMSMLGGANCVPSSGLARATGRRELIVSPSHRRTAPAARRSGAGAGRSAKAYAAPSVAARHRCEHRVDPAVGRVVVGQYGRPLGRRYESSARGRRRENPTIPVDAELFRCENRKTPSATDLAVRTSSAHVVHADHDSAKSKSGATPRDVHRGRMSAMMAPSAAPDRAVRKPKTLGSRQDTRDTAGRDPERAKEGTRAIRLAVASCSGHSPPTTPWMSPRPITVDTYEKSSAQVRQPHEFGGSAHVNAVSRRRKPER